MKHFERRAEGGFPYFKLAEWDARNCCWKDGKQSHATPDDAILAAKKPGRYRISRVDENGRTDLEPFEIS